MNTVMSSQIVTTKTNIVKASTRKLRNVKPSSKNSIATSMSLTHRLDAAEMPPEQVHEYCDEQPDCHDEDEYCEGIDQEVAECETFVEEQHRDLHVFDA